VAVLHRRILAQAVGPLIEAVAPERSDATDRLLALVLAFVAGAVNAGALVAVGQYTSHMSGIVSALADNLALGGWLLVGGGLGALLAFAAGAAISAWLINWARRHRVGVQYALPLLLEAALLAGFGLAGVALHNWPGFAATAVPLLCFIMGLQNATITKVSGARMRTTHVTGIVTDIGIELGKLAYWNRDPTLAGRAVLADRAKLRLLGWLLATFFLGGLVGAFGFAWFGYAATLPLALILALFGGAPAVAGALARAGG